MPSFISPALKPDSTRRAQIGLWRCHLGLALIISSFALQVGMNKTHTVPKPPAPTACRANASLPTITANFPCAPAVLAALLCLERAVHLLHQTQVHVQIPFSGMCLPSNTSLNKCYSVFRSDQVTFPQQSNC